MPNTYTQLYIQFVFAAKNRFGFIQQRWKDELYKYITGIVQKKGSKLLAINGMPDHIHIFIGYKPVISIPDLVKDIKVSSTQWVNHSKLTLGSFGWQEGYGAFSYSRSELSRVCNYIENQEIHHQHKSFRKEYTDFLKAFEVEYDTKYLFQFFDEEEILKW